ncbi:MAG: hypothetical protein LLG13_13755 [Bacteroidales bacterium]|nr:hypothetical protein [Bacteroidales bacterium]
MKKLIKHFTIILITMFLIVQNSIAQDDILFRRYLISSGVTGMYYGIAFDVIFELDEAAAAGLPVITAGTSVLVPLLVNTDRRIDYDALVLRGHGKTIGWAHGFALSTLIGGEDAWAGDESNNYKLTVGLGALSSVGLGILGNSLAANNNWSEGRVELYRHYGWVMPFTGLCLAGSISDEARLFGAADLLFGAGGYLIADKVSNRREFTRGDVRSMQVLTLLNTGLGFGIMADKNDDINSEFNRTDWLIPAIGALSGTFIGQAWLKNAKLTPQQGLLTSYAAAGGAIIGLGIALMTDSSEATPYYLIPYATGLGAYAYTVERLRKKNSTQAYLPDKHKNNFNLSFMPQNLFLNNKIQHNDFLVNGRLVGMQPLFAASLSF